MIFVLRPGYVLSKTDRDEHYISVDKLKHLYSLAEHEYLAYQDFDWADLKPITPDNWRYEDKIILGPRYEGDYLEYKQKAITEFIEKRVKKFRDSLEKELAKHILQKVKHASNT